MKMVPDFCDQNPFDGCADLKAIEGALSRYVDGLGLLYFSYLLMRAPRFARAGAAQILLTDYPDEWRERYLGRYYQLYDPVAFLGGHSRLPFAWNGGPFLKPFRKDQKRVFHEARAFRIISGYSIPVYGPDGDVGLFSVVGGREGDLADAVRAKTADLQLMATQLHDRVVAGLSESPGQATPDLSARESECLLWTAEGKTTDEISDLICLSGSTVNYHLGKAARKLGASNRHHAAILAIRAGLI